MCIINARINMYYRDWAGVIAQPVKARFTILS